MNIKLGGETEPCSVYYQLKVGFCEIDTIIEFKVVCGLIMNKDPYETNVLQLHDGWCQSPEFKLEIGIATINVQKS